MFHQVPERADVDIEVAPSNAECGANLLCDWGRTTEHPRLAKFYSSVNCSIAVASMFKRQSLPAA